MELEFLKWSKEKASDWLTVYRELLLEISTLLEGLIN